MGVADGIVGDLRLLPGLSTVKLAKSGIDDEEAFGNAGRWLKARLAVSRPTAVWIEKPITIPGRSGSTERRLTGLWAALATVANMEGVPCHLTDVQTVRAWFAKCGMTLAMREDKRGRPRPVPPSKQDLEARVQAAGLNPANLDESDAAAGWFWAAALYGGPRDFREWLANSPNKSLPLSPKALSQPSLPVDLESRATR